MGGDKKKEGRHLSQEAGPHQTPDVSASILEFFASRNERNARCCLSHSVHGTLLQHPELRHLIIKGVSVSRIHKLLEKRPSLLPQQEKWNFLRDGRIPDSVGPKLGLKEGRENWEEREVRAETTCTWCTCQGLPSERILPITNSVSARWLVLRESSESGCKLERKT